MKEKTKARESNVELLRIILAIGVVFLHYIKNRAMNEVESGSANELILYILESIFICAVDLFMLISGYFMVTNNKRKILRPLELILEVSCINVFFYLSNVAIGKQSFSLSTFFSRLIPARYFVIFYVVVYFVSVYINVVINKLDRKSLYIMLTVLVIIFSVYPTVIDMIQDFTCSQIDDISTITRAGSMDGYTIVNFTLMYIIGAVLRVAEPPHIKSRYLIAVYLFTVAVITIWCYTMGLNNAHTATSYCNPLVILQAVTLFMLFRNFKLGSSRIINRAAKASFTVYLIHGSLLPFTFYEKVVRMNPFIMTPLILLTAVAIYIFSWLFYEVWNFLYSHTINKLLEKASPPDLVVKI